MESDTRWLAELFYMVACYRRRNQSDKAVSLLKDIISLKHASFPDSKRVLAICLYNLADIYQEYRPKTIIARDLYRQAAELWNEIEPDNPLNIMWYFGAMQGLQEETDRLVVLGAKQAQAGPEQASA